MESTTRHILIVDSRDRDFSKHSSPTSYRIDLPVAYRRVTMARLTSCEIPCTFFIFSAALGNVTLKVSLFDDVGLTSVTRAVVVPDGNYGTLTISAALTAALNKAFLSEEATFDVTFEPATLKLTFKCIQGRLLEVDTTSEASHAPTGWGLGYHLGFRKGEVFRGVSVTCPSVMTLNPYTYILLDIEGLGSLDECSINEPGNGGTVFAKIPLTNDSFDVIMAHGTNACISGRRPFKPALSRVDRLSISFRFHDGLPVDFNNVDHSFTLEFHCQN